MSWSSIAIGKICSFLGNFARHRSITVNLRNIHEHTYRIGYDLAFSGVIAISKRFWFDLKRRVTKKVKLAYLNRVSMY